MNNLEIKIKNNINNKENVKKIFFNLCDKKFNDILKTINIVNSYNKGIYSNLISNSRINESEIQLPKEFISTKDISKVFSFDNSNNLSEFIIFEIDNSKQDTLEDFKKDIENNFDQIVTIKVVSTKLNTIKNMTIEDFENNLIKKITKDLIGLSFISNSINYNRNSVLR